MYALVKNGKVESVQDNLPVSYKNVSNFHKMPEDKLPEYGWYPVDVHDPGFDPETEKYESTDVVRGNRVQRTYRAVPMSTDERKAAKKATADRRMSKSSKDIGMIVLAMAEKLFASGALVDADFTPEEFDAYQQLKAIRDGGLE